MKILPLSFALALLALPAVARAQDDGGLSGLPQVNLNSTPVLSSQGALAGPPDVIHDKEAAMIYWRLAGQTPPDFDKMVMELKDYKEAQTFNKSNVKDSLKADLQQIYNNMTFNEPKVVRMKVHLSDFSEKNKGFLITDFEDQTYFKFNFAGEKYAIVPLGLVDRQFLGPITEEEKVKAIKAKMGTERAYHLMVYVKPNWADPPGTLTEIDGEQYHVISAPVSHISLFGWDEQQELWADASPDFNPKQNQELMNLKQ